MHCVAVTVAEHLDLDVPRAHQVALKEHRRIAERRCRLAAGGGDRIEQFALVVDRPHALATAAGRGLDKQRIPNPITRCDQVFVGGIGVDLRAGNQRHARGFGKSLGLDLQRHRADRIGCRPDPDQPSVSDSLSKVGVLGEEAVAGVNRVSARALCCVEDLGDVEVRLGAGHTAKGDGEVGIAYVRCAAIRFAEDRDRLNRGRPHRRRGSENPSRNLASVGHEQPAYLGCWRHVRTRDRTRTRGVRGWRALRCGRRRCHLCPSWFGWLLVGIAITSGRRRSCSVDRRLRHRRPARRRCSHPRRGSVRCGMPTAPVTRPSGCRAGR